MSGSSILESVNGGMHLQLNSGAESLLLELRKSHVFVLFLRVGVSKQ